VVSIDRIWDSFWSGGRSNVRGHTLEENKANRLKKPMEWRVFRKGKDSQGRLVPLAAEAGTQINTASPVSRRRFFGASSTGKCAVHWI